MLCAPLPRRLSIATLALVTTLAQAVAGATETGLESGGDFLARRGMVGATAPCSSIWQQCGGNDWTGPTCCDEDTFCSRQSEWYSQCKPGTVSPTPSPPPTAPSLAPTSQPTTLESCSGLWGQCGGKYWTGALCCKVGSCVMQSEWYSQCKPGSSLPTSSPTPAVTTAPTAAPTPGDEPSPSPTRMPTSMPTSAPTQTAKPTQAPTPVAEPTPLPTAAPTPGDEPSPSPTRMPTSAPTQTTAPTQAPTASPTPVQPSAGARGFWYSAFASGGTGAVNCAPVTASLETAPGSDTYTQSAWFNGNSPTTWCTGTNPNQQKPWISYLTSGEIAFPGSFGVQATQWQPITNSFEGGMDDFEVKWFTVGGGGTVWDTTQLNYLLGDCSGGKSLTEIIKDAGYTGVMIDYEDESGLAPQQLVDFMSDFDASMKLSFTAMGTGGGLTATSTLTQALADPSVSGKWESVVPQLYDASSCLYATQFMSQAKTLFAGVEPSKILLGIPQGVDPTTCCTDFADTNGGFVEWLYRPVPQA